MNTNFTNFRILSIDGGGSRGLILAQVLVALERKFGEITEMVDYQLEQIFASAGNAGGYLRLNLDLPGNSSAWRMA